MTSRFKRTLYWLIPTLLVLSLILLTPKIVSTSIGKPLLIRAFEARLKGNITIETAHLSWFGPQTFKNITYTNPDVVGQIDILESSVPFWALSDLGDSFHLQNGSFSFPTYGGSQISQIGAKIEGSEVDATGATSQGGFLSLKGKIYSKEDFDIVADCKRVPSGALDPLFKTKGLLYQLLGPFFDLKGAMVYNHGEGTLSFDLSSTQAQASLNAALTENALTLKEPFLATFRLTPELGAALSSRASPLLLTGVEGRDPIVFRIATKNFVFPLKLFSFEKLRVGNGTLDMGRIRATPGKSLRSLLKLLKSPNNSGQINVWFTPVSFQMEEGVIQTGRMDALLADAIHICTWGDIDIASDRLNLFLGLPAATLAQAFGLNNLPRNYVLKIPIRGSIQDPDIDTGAASSKIAAMVAAQQIPKVAGKPGKLFGGVLNLFAGPKEDEDVPPPNRPFPWER